VAEAEPRLSIALILTQPDSNWEQGPDSRWGRILLADVDRAGVRSRDNQPDIECLCQACVDYYQRISNIRWFPLAVDPTSMSMKDQQGMRKHCYLAQSVAEAIDVDAVAW